MVKIKPTDSKREIVNKLLSGKVTLENPYYKPCIELMDAIAFLKRHKQKVPKMLEELFEELHKKNLSYNPLKQRKER